MRQSFGKEYKLKSKKQIDLLFSKGKRMHQPVVSLIYLRVENESPEPISKPKIMVSVPKRLFKKAVDRNLLKRRMREAIRLFIHSEYNFESTSHHYYMALMYKDTRIRDFNDIQASIDLLLRKLETKHNVL